VRPQPAPSNAGGVTIRALRIRPEIALTISPVDLNVVLQRLELPESEKFDLIIATNTLVYYDVFEQSLASVNIGRMLKRGGFLLSNNALIEFPFSSVRSVGYKTTVYSERGVDGDHVVWYRRS
jgi:chemotaxis methyl-accepting protein methylase